VIAGKVYQIIKELGSGNDVQIMLQMIEWEEPYRTSLEDRLGFTLNQEH
jgi:hypothetical protein